MATQMSLMDMSPEQMDAYFNSTVVVLNTSSISVGMSRYNIT